jgi:8-oxo-dGTP diphosphatase
MPGSDQINDNKRYSLIPRTLIFLLNGTHLLLLKGSPNKKLWANKYNGIGGHVEKGEDILSAAKREIKEETGLTSLELTFCGCITIDVDPNNGICIFLFRSDLSESFKEQVIVNSSSEGVLEWIDSNKLSDYRVVEDLHTLIPVIVNHQPDDHPIWWQYKYSENGELLISKS